jgi:hypothetical protein
VGVATVGLSGLLLLVITFVGRGGSVLGIVGPAAMLLVCAYFVANPRIEVSLAILMLYLGLLDGYLKLRTGSRVMTLGRDALFYSIVIGLLIRMTIRHDRIRVPPFAGHVLAFVLLVVVQIANPADANLHTSLSGLRPHLEWVPLFVIGFLVLRDLRRLRFFFILLLLMGCVNGFVGLVQFNLSPQQLAGWGSGYSHLVLGTGNFVGGARNFADSTGVVRVRPPALGSDEGFGGVLAMLAIPGGLALVGFASSGRLRVVALLGIGGLSIGVVTSQARSVAVAAVAAVVAYGLLSARSRQRGVAIVSIAAGLAMFYVLVSAFVSSNASGAFERFGSIAPSQLAGSYSAARGSSLAVIPAYIGQIPLGGGLGRTGPAAVVATGGASGFNAETEFSYLIVETGVPGMLMLFALTIRLLMASLRIIPRVEDPETRAMIAALAAPLFSILGLWFVSTTSATTPLAPYFWLTAGGLAYWLTESVGDRRRP